MNLNIKRPSEEEMNANCVRALNKVKDTFIENWPNGLRQLSMKTFLFEMPDDLFFGMVKYFNGEGRNYLDCRDMTTTKSMIDDIIDMNGDVFVKLSSRSPKDSDLFVNAGGKIKSGSDAINMLLESFERIPDDLFLMHAAGYRPYIAIRKWIDIPRWSEFRCFVKNRTLYAISQYFYRDTFPKIINNATRIEESIHKFFPRFNDVCHLDDVVFDVFLSDDFEPTLIEINPHDKTKTDPCLYTMWDDSMFSVPFRYNK